MADTDKWYKDFCDAYKNGICKKCEHKGHVADGTCYEGCCDKWRCPKCGNTFLVELG